MESCANEGEEVQISVSKCFKCTCQVSWDCFCRYYMYSMCTSFISLGLSVQSAPVPEMTRLQRHNSTNMSEIKRNSFHVARINLTGYPPCYTPPPLRAVWRAAWATPMSSQDMHRGCAEWKWKRICCGCGHVSYISYTSQCLPDAARKCLYVSLSS